MHEEASVREHEAIQDAVHLRRLREKGWNPYNPLSWITGEPKIGKRTWIGAFCLIDGLGGLEIGDDCNISSGAHILTHSTVKRCVTGQGEMDKVPTKIGSRVFVGENATILMGCTIGNRCVIGAGAVVLEGTTIPDECVFAGSPSKYIRRMSPDSLKHGYTTSCKCDALFDPDGVLYFCYTCQEHR